LHPGATIQISKRLEPDNRWKIIDAMKQQLHQAARQSSEDALSFLRISEVFGNLIDDQTFTNVYLASVHRLYKGNL
jgi:mannitol 2-dehydrogenase